jgi:hypothetical protein
MILISFISFSSVSISIFDSMSLKYDIWTYSSNFKKIKGWRNFGPNKIENEIWYLGQIVLTW